MYVQLRAMYICKCVLPVIMPFNGTNPRSILVLDNASIHHLDQVYDIITGVGAKLCFLPPYSPDLMPLEEVFSEVKYVLKAKHFCQHQTQKTLLNLFCAITEEDCIHYIREAGYYKKYRLS